MPKMKYQIVKKYKVAKNNNSFLRSPQNKDYCLQIFIYFVNIVILCLIDKHILVKMYCFLVVNIKHIYVN